MHYLFLSKLNLRLLNHLSASFFFSVMVTSPCIVMLLQSLSLFISKNSFIAFLNAVSSLFLLKPFTYCINTVSKAPNMDEKKGIVITYPKADKT